MRGAFMKIDYLVYIGRFQPFHNGHKSVIERALQVATKGVIVLIGSSFGAPNSKNPFMMFERAEMIKSEFLQSNVIVDFLHDYKYNNLQWITEVQTLVKKNIFASQGMTSTWADKPPTVKLIGLNKDESTKYLEWFPQWGDPIQADAFGDGRFDATTIREMLFDGRSTDFMTGVVPQGSMTVINNFKRSARFDDLREEFNYVREYKRRWSVAPFAPTFVTVDAVVIQDGYILLVKRGVNPGRGLWALPGGFLEQTETIEDGMIRELDEETKIKLQEIVIRRAIAGYRVFDAPDRSLRGRTITHAFLVKLASVGAFPKVKGHDDATEAKWIALTDLTEDTMFEDHWHIINYFKNRL